jgi:hypothetical protein
MVKLFSSNKQVLAMIPNEEMLNLDNVWRASGSAIRVFCVYETLPTGGTMAVDVFSATLGCNGQAFPVNSNHVDLVKPCDTSSDSYVVFANLIKGTSASTH